MWRDSPGLALVLAIMVTLATVGGCAGLICFSCTVQPPSSRSNETARLCNLFDHSNHYHVECPFSTFCMKRTFQLTLQQGKKVKVSERGCAPQKRNEQVFKNGDWHVENKIEGDVYSAGCVQDDGAGLRSPSEYCYCPTNLCNAAPAPAPALPLAFAVIPGLIYILGLR